MVEGPSTKQRGKYFYNLEEDKVKFVLGAFEGENCCEVTLLGNISFFYVRQMEEVQLFKKLERFMHWFEEDGNDVCILKVKLSMVEFSNVSVELGFAT